MLRLVGTTMLAATAVLLAGCNNTPSGDTVEASAENVADANAADANEAVMDNGTENGSILLREGGSDDREGGSDDRAQGSDDRAAGSDDRVAGSDDR